MTIEASTGPLLDAFVTNASCGLSNGVIELDGRNGEPPYMYSIDGGVTFTTITIFPGLTGDMVYELVVKDANGCLHTQFEYLDTIARPVIDSIIITPATCGFDNASVIIYASGTPTLTYSIDCSDFVNTNTFTDLAPGSLTLCIQDGTGCRVTANILIIDIPGPQIDDVIVTSPDCGIDNGIIEIEASGGTPPLTYSLDSITFVAGNIFNGLASGSYTVYVLDANSCPDSQDVFIAPPILDTILLDTLICDTASITIGGTMLSGDGTYTVVLSAAPPVCDTVVIVTITTYICCEEGNSKYCDYHLSG